MQLFTGQHGGAEAGTPPGPSLAPTREALWTVARGSSLRSLCAAFPLPCILFKSANLSRILCVFLFEFGTDTKKSSSRDLSV